MMAIIAKYDIDHFLTITLHLGKREE